MSERAYFEATVYGPDPEGQVRAALDGLTLADWPTAYGTGSWVLVVGQVDVDTESPDEAAALVKGRLTEGGFDRVLTAAMPQLPALLMEG